MNSSSILKLSPLRLVGEHNNRIFNLIMDLKKIYGIGIKSEKNLKRKFGINDRIIRSSVYCIPEKLQQKIDAKIAKKFLVDRNLYNKRTRNINFYKNINCYRGIRHKNKYPVRGQRTHTNATKKNYKFGKFI